MLNKKFFVLFLFTTLLVVYSPIALLIQIGFGLGSPSAEYKSIAEYGILYIPIMRFVFVNILLTILILLFKLFIHLIKIKEISLRYLLKISIPFYAINFSYLIISVVYLQIWLNDYNINLNGL